MNMEKQILLVIVILASLTLVGASNNSINNSVPNEEKNISLIEKEMEEPVLLPSDFGYSFKRFGEEIRLFLTFSARERIKYKTKLMGERAIELKKAIDKNKGKDIMTLSIEYGETIEEISSRLREMEKEGQKVSTLQEIVSDVTNKHALVFKKNLEKASRTSRGDILEAINNSKKGFIEARKSIARERGKNESEINREIKEFRGELKRVGKKKVENVSLCIQVITPARNPETGECKEYPTPCDVPNGWEKIEGSCKEYNNSRESGGTSRGRLNNKNSPGVANVPL